MFVVTGGISFGTTGTRIAERTGDHLRDAVRGSALFDRPAHDVVRRAAAGVADQGLGDGVGGRGDLLPDVEPDGDDHERERRPSEHETAGCDNAAQPARYSHAQRDHVRPRRHRPAGADGA
jgi:hypothetical protein